MCAFHLLTFISKISPLVLLLLLSVCYLVLSFVYLLPCLTKKSNEYVSQFRLLISSSLARTTFLDLNEPKVQTWENKVFDFSLSLSPVSYTHLTLPTMAVV